MRNLKMAKNIVAGRRGLGITQAELAERVGVTKAAVSKWELGQSLPDVAMLPRLASQFGITVDELIGYGQELSDDELSAVLQEVAQLSVTDRDAAIARCEAELREHGSSWNLLVTVAGLYVGWAALAEQSGEKGSASVLRGRADELCRRVAERSHDAGAVFRARQLQASLLLSEGNARGAAELLEGMAMPDGVTSSCMLLEAAYRKLGREEDARALRRRRLADATGSLLSDLLDQINASGDAAEVARLADTGERARGALGWAFEGDVPSPRITAAARLLELGEESAALDQLGALLADGEDGGITGQLARALLGDDSIWHDEALAARRAALISSYEKKQAEEGVHHEEARSRIPSSITSMVGALGVRGAAGNGVCRQRDAAS